MGEPQASALRRCLQRMDSARATLEGIDDLKARSVARELIEAVLDLHGLAFAKAITIAQSGVDGDMMSRRLAEDECVSAVMLLHGLHPDEAESRLRKKIATMHPHWGVRGFHVELQAVNGLTAKVRVHWGENRPRPDRTSILLEIEEMLTEAAPDLDQILLEEVEYGVGDGGYAAGAGKRNA
jgi:hypothetical protein